MRTIAKIFNLSLVLLMTSCSALNRELKASPIENSAFAARALSEAGAAATPSSTYPFHRVWRNDEEISEVMHADAVYVAPVDTTALFDRERNPEPIGREDAERLASYLRRHVEDELREHSFRVVSERPQIGRVIELALVEVSSTDIVRNVLGTAVGAFIPGGGLIAAGSSGSTAIEGVVRDSASDRPLFVFADRERGKIAPFSFNDFTRYSHARDAMNDWSKQIVKACSLPRGAQLAGSSRFTLLPL